MTVYHVYANASDGYYEAADLQGARDAFAADAGYQSEADMERQLEQPIQIVAEPATVEIGGQRVSYDGAVNLMDRDLCEEVCERLRDEAERGGTRAPWPQEIADAYSAAHEAALGEPFVVN